MCVCDGVNTHTAVLVSIGCGYILIVLFAFVPLAPDSDC